jgi:hypothetical protein
VRGVTPKRPVGWLLLTAGFVVDNLKKRFNKQETVDSKQATVEALNALVSGLG